MNLQFKLSALCTGRPQLYIFSVSLISLRDCTRCSALQLNHRIAYFLIIRSMRENTTASTLLIFMMLSTISSLLLMNMSDNLRSFLSSSRLSFSYSTRRKSY